MTHHLLMKIWLNGRRRDLKLTPAAQSAGVIVLVLFFLVVNLVNHEHLDWLFWVSLAVALWLLSSSTTSLIHRCRAGDRVRITADVVSVPKRSPDH